MIPSPIPLSAKRIPDGLATILKRVLPFKELANNAATALKELETARREVFHVERV